MASLPAAPETVYAATAPQAIMSTAYKTTDTGMSWAAIADSPTARVNAIAIVPSCPTIVYAIGSDYQSPPTSAVYRSEDAGLSWEQAHTFSALLTDLALDPIQSETLYVGGIAAGRGYPPVAVWKSTDGGATWIERSGGLFGNWLVALLVAPSNPERLYVATDSNLLRSDNGAACWAPADNGLGGLGSFQGLGTDPHNSDVLFAGISRLESNRLVAAYIAKSSDGGQSWALTPFPYSVVSFTVDPTDPNRVYAGAAHLGGFFSPLGGIFRSEDGGLQWHPFMNGLAPLGFGLSALTLTIDSSGRFLHAATTRGVFDLEIDPDARAPILPAPRGGPREVPFRPD